jgi:hypothetical protein
MKKWKISKIRLRTERNEAIEKIWFSLPYYFLRIYVSQFPTMTMNIKF